MDKKGEFGARSQKSFCTPRDPSASPWVPRGGTKMTLVPDPQIKFKFNTWLPLLSDSQNLSHTQNSDIVSTQVLKIT